MNKNIDYSGQCIDKYQLLKRLGSGSFGVVYKAHDRILDVDMALKILEVSDPQLANKLFSEAAIPYKCQHNNIVKINGAQIATFDNKLHFIVDMQLVNGGSIEDLLNRRQLSVIDGLRMMKDILFGIEYSHTKKFIHRDIKPANILIDNNIPKIADFGLSATLNKLIIPSIWYGTHAAPETYKNSIATIETDIFALGMTLYRMVNNISDWWHFVSSIPSAQKLMKNGKFIDKLPFKPYVPKAVEKIIKKACNADANKRYHSASEMRNAIEKLKYLYNWNEISEWHWMSNLERQPQKDITLNVKAKKIEIVVKNNNRKSTIECQTFFDQIEAEKYFMNYIANSTIRR